MNNLSNSAGRTDSSQLDMPALLLVGGMGTRLRPVLSSKPKPLAPIGNIPFLELLVLQLRSQGVHRIVMCTGFQADQIKEEFADGRKWGVTIEYSNETTPLGTAGAVKLAAPFVASDSDFLVLNGDSFLELDFRELIPFHQEHGGCATVAVRRVPDAARYGTVHVDEQNRIVRFSEKMGLQQPGLINGGVYVCSSSILKDIPAGAASLEKELLPGLLEHGVYALEQKGMFIDIGTPEDYVRAQALHRSLCQAALSDSQFWTQERRPR